MQELRDVSKCRDQSLNPPHAPAFGSCLSAGKFTLTVRTLSVPLYLVAPERGLLLRSWEGISASETLSCRRAGVMLGAPGELQGLWGLC